MIAVLCDQSRAEIARFDSDALGIADLQPLLNFAQDNAGYASDLLRQGGDATPAIEAIERVESSAVLLSRLAGMVAERIAQGPTP